jgi:hypothetical protein
LHCFSQNIVDYIFYWFSSDLCAWKQKTYDLNCRSYVWDLKDKHLKVFGAVRILLSEIEKASRFFFPYCFRKKAVYEAYQQEVTERGALFNICLSATSHDCGEIGSLQAFKQESLCLSKATSSLRWFSIQTEMHTLQFILSLFLPLLLISF